MHIKVSPSVETFKGDMYQSLSIGFNVVYSNPRVVNVHTTYTNKIPEQKRYLVKDRFLSLNRPSEYTYKTNFTFNKKFRELRISVQDLFSNGSGKINRITYRDSFNSFNLFKELRQLKFVSTFNIRKGFRKRTERYVDIFNTNLDQSSFVRVMISDRFDVQKVKERSRVFIDTFKVFPVTNGVYLYRDIFKNSISKYLFNEDSHAISVSDGFANLSYIINKERLGISQSDNVRVFVNMPPAYINYCATLTSDKGAAHLTEDAENFILVLPRIVKSDSEDDAISKISKMSHLTISIYRYNTVESDGRKIENGELLVSTNIFDPEPLSNLNLKSIDIRDESISINKDQKDRNSDSKLFEIRFLTSRNCCFDRDIIITGRGSSICNIPDVIVQYDIITREQDGQFLFNNRLKGFERRISKIEQDSASKPRP